MVYGRVVFYHRFYLQFMLMTLLNVYADDILLLSGSCYGLQKLLDICGNYGIEWDIKFNPGKSVACTLSLIHI